MTVQKHVNPEAIIDKGDVWFVYDGDCPICNMAAQSLRIKHDVGALHVVDARAQKDHPILREIQDMQHDLDQGMVLKFRERLYHGKDALHMMALLGSPHGWFNRMNAALFRSKTLASLCYPAMRATRNALLRVKGVPKIQNLQMQEQKHIFRSILGDTWEVLPPIMHKHYDIRAYSDDSVTITGALDVNISLFVKIMAHITGMLLPYSGRDIPVTVTLHAKPNSPALHFHRVFHFPDHGDVTFHSAMEPIGGNELVEFMRFGVGWKLAYHWYHGTIILSHRGYVWRIFGRLIPIPLSWLIGRGHAEETALSDNSFSMWTHAKHPIFGATFGYSGTLFIASEEQIS